MTSSVDQAAIKTQKHDNQRHLEENLSVFVVSTVPAGHELLLVANCDANTLPFDCLNSGYITWQRIWV